MDDKEDNFNLILVIIDRLTKMIYNKPVKIIIYVASIAKVIIDVAVRHHGLFDLIITN